MIPQRVHNFGTYFITSKTWEGHSIFQVDRNARLFLEKLYHYRTEEKYFLHEFVDMPDHVIITPREMTIERAVQSSRAALRTPWAKRGATRKSGKRVLRITGFAMQKITSSTGLIFVSIRFVTDCALLPKDILIVQHSSVVYWMLSPSG